MASTIVEKMMPLETAALKVRMARRVYFSSGHRYWLSSLDDVQNRELYGPWASPFNHGHNYVLDVTVEGEIDPVTSMIVNIKTIDDCLRKDILSKFDGKSLNDEVEAFKDRAPSLENLLVTLREMLTRGCLPEQVRLVGIRLEETPTLFAELREENGKEMMTLTRVYEFAASHRLHAPGLSDEENVELFGKCNNLAGHGHNYVLEVTVSGQPSPRTGMLVDLDSLDDKVNALVIDRYDHKNLNQDLPEFQGRPTTSEAVALEIFNTLAGKLPTKLERVRLLETARNIFEVSAS